MRHITNKPRILIALVASAAVATIATGCSAPSGSGEEIVVQFWDQYPQYQEGSAWVDQIQACADEAGVKVNRTVSESTALLNNALLAAQQKAAPDVIVLDNATISTLASAGALVPNDESGLSAEGVLPALLEAGIWEGKTYGTYFGANTTALYYNKTVLAEAGVDVATVTDWASLEAAFEKVAAIGKMPMTFSAVGTEEGTFQFLEWFWGADGDLRQMDDAGGVAALTLWTDWVAKGWAPQSVLTNNQFAAFDQFLTGEYAFVQGGPWSVPFANDSGMDYGIMSIPGQNGGIAPATPGGEFIALPRQVDTARYAASSAIINCLTSPDNIIEVLASLNYIATTEEGQAIQIENDPAIQIWVDTINNARMRTGDGLGTDYPIISQQLWTAMQNAISGTLSPEQALKDGQEKATEEIANAG